MADTPEAKAREIAERLTRAQRRALLSGLCYGRTMNALFDLGIAQGAANFRTGIYDWRFSLTPFGDQVRGCLSDA